MEAYHSTQESTTQGSGLGAQEARADPLSGPVAPAAPEDLTPSVPAAPAAPSALGVPSTGGVSSVAATVVAAAAAAMAVSSRALAAVSAAATSISIVGPGLGQVIGPAYSFSQIPEIAKWLLSFGMLAGRLEFLTLIVIFNKSFWR